MAEHAEIAVDDTDGAGSANEKRGNKREREKDEEQFILRLPAPLSEQMRLGLASKARRDAAGSETKFHIHFVNERHAYFHVNKQRYGATLFDLPAIAETHKTADKRTYFKSTDVHQVLIVRLPALSDDAPPPEEPSKQPGAYLLPDGIAPASRGAARRFHVPPPSFDDEQTALVENQIKWVVDNKVQFVRKKPRSDDVDVEIEVETESSAPTTKGAAVPAPKASSVFNSASKNAKPGTGVTGATTAVQKSDPSTAVNPAPTSIAAVSDAPALTSAPITAPKLQSTLREPVKQPKTVLPPKSEPEPAPVPTPAPATPADIDDDDLEMFGEALMAEDDEDNDKKRMEIALLDGKIEDQKAKIKQVHDEAAKLPNPVLKRRILSKVPELEKTLKELEDQRKALD